MVQLERVLLLKSLVWGIKMGVPEICPLKYAVELHGGKLKPNFDCSKCLVNPTFCRRYLSGQISCLKLRNMMIECRTWALREVVTL